MLLSLSPRIPRPAFPRRPQASEAGILLPAGTEAGNYVVNVFAFVRNAFGATAVSAPFPVRVTWDPAVLASPAEQAKFVDGQQARVDALFNMGQPAGALSAVSGVSSLLNQGSSSRRRRLLRLGGEDAGRGGMHADGEEQSGQSGRRVTLEEQTRASQREGLLASVAGVAQTVALDPDVRGPVWLAPAYAFVWLCSSLLPSGWQLPWAF